MNALFFPAQSKHNANNKVSTLPWLQHWWEILPSPCMWTDVATETADEQLCLKDYTAG